MISTAWGGMETGLSGEWEDGEGLECLSAGATAVWYNVDKGVIVCEGG